MANSNRKMSLRHDLRPRACLLSLFFGNLGFHLAQGLGKRPTVIQGDMPEYKDTVALLANPWEGQGDTRGNVNWIRQCGSHRSKFRFDLRQFRTSFTAQG
jgi:hypothetical protein